MRDKVEKTPNYGQFLAPKILRGGGIADINVSKLQQLPITTAYFVAIGRRVSENEGLI